MKKILACVALLFATRTVMAQTPCIGCSGGGVGQIVAGTNVTVSPPAGTGTVTVNSTSGGVGPGTAVQPALFATSTTIKSSILNLAVVSEGESRLAGAFAPCSAATFDSGGNHNAGNCGSNGNMDIPSVMVRSSNFINRVAYFINANIGGTTCAQMVTNWGTNNLVNYKPGGSSALNATQSILLIQTTANDALQGTSLTSYQTCMSNHLLNDATANGFDPVLLTGWYDGADAAAMILQTQYNDWIRSLNGTVMNSHTIRVVDAESIVGKDTTVAKWANPVNSSNTVYLVTAYSITGGALTITTASSTTQASTSTSIECGGFQTSTFLNYAHATYSSGAGTGSLVVTLATPFANTSGTVTENGVCWSYQTSGSYSLHLGVDGLKWFGEELNDQLGLALIGSRNTVNGGVNDYEYIAGQVKTIYNAGLIVEAQPLSANGTSNSSSTDCTNTTAISPGEICSIQAMENLNGTPSSAGWFPGSGRIRLGGLSTYIGCGSGNCAFHGGIYSGAAGAIGKVVVNAAGTSYAIGDTGTVVNGGTNATYKIIAITFGGSCLYAAQGQTGPACAAIITAGGSGNSAANGIATSATSGTGTGMTLNLTLSATGSQQLNMTFAGANLVGGSISACATGATCGVDTAGNLYSINSSSNGGALKFGSTSSTEFIIGSTVSASNSFRIASGGGIQITSGGSFGINLQGPVNHTGTAQTAANITASTGWGTSGAAGNGISAVAGANNRFRFTITAAGVPSANPTFVATFPQTFTSAPLCDAQQTGGTGVNVNINSGTATTTSTGTFTWVGTPVATLTYIIDVTCL